MVLDDKNIARFLIPASDAQKPHCSEFVTRKSRFLAQCAHCASAEQARDFVAQIRAAHPGATHNCWAFVAGPPASTTSIGSSDDGEPHGTAGKPILQALLHGGVGEICMVVTRWFGGVKLGTGGLVRAYQQSALDNLATLPCQEGVSLASWRITADYAHAERMARLLPELEAKIECANYHAQAEFLITAPEDRGREIEDLVGRISNGKAHIEKLA